ncbi:MAG: alpha/beta hydrolase [Acidimicrobiales bacterium]|nr:alpha/beta hydrolase [Acidimicrobiales bacterium]
MYIRDKGVGTPVVLLHGQPGHGRNWKPVIESLGTGFRTLSPDRPGYGLSGESATSMSQNAELILDELTVRGVDQFVLVGHSLGGGIAIHMAHMAPERVLGMVLAGSIGTRSCLTQLDYILATPVIGDLLALAGLISLDILLPWVNDHVDLAPQFFRNEAQLRLRHSPVKSVSPRPFFRTWKTFVTEQLALVADIDQLADILESISVGCVLLSGTEDDVIPKSSIKELNNKLAKSELVWVEGAGHLLTIEAPEKIAHFVKKYALN